VNITYACPSCEEGVRIHFDADTPELDCPHCQSAITINAGTIDKSALDGNRVKSCLVCPSTDLFVRKDFPQRLGVGLVVIGIVGSSIAWYYSNVLWTFGILFATALIDVGLYSIVGDALMCYRCQAQYRGVEGMDTHCEFDLETHEKYRQLEARLEGTKE